MFNKRLMLSMALCLAVTVHTLTLGTVVAGDREMEILGWIEDVRLAPGDLMIRAKLDTGADNSSLNAPDAKEFKRDDKRWVRFSVENQHGVKQVYEKPAHRMVRIRSASGTSRRYVVKMDICLGNILREVEVNLADRSDLSYQMLIGRSFMKDHILVDSGRKDTRKPVCDMDAEPERIPENEDGGETDNEAVYEDK